MNWYTLVMNYRYSDNRKLALVMAQMWQTSAEIGGDALLSNLTVNPLDVAGVAMHMDSQCVPVPEKVMLILLA